MTSPLLPPNPCLVAVLLIVNYHHIPRIAFHYPPKPGEDDAHLKNYFSNSFTDGEILTSSDEDSASSSNDRTTTDGARFDKSKNGNLQDGDFEEAGSASPEKIEGMSSMQKCLQWNDIFGYHSPNLAKILCPPLSSHKRRFEMSLNGKAFLGWPVFAKDGTWQRKKGAKKLKAQDQKLGEGTEAKEEDQIASDKNLLPNMEALDDDSEQNSDGDWQKKSQGTGTDPADVAAFLQDLELKPDKTPEDASGHKKAKDDISMDTLKLFHVVFVLDPPPLEYHLRMKEMYHHVVKKFSRALKWEQSRSNYVSKEVAIVTSICKSFSKSGGVNNSLTTMYHQILSQSSLAKAISTLYNSISNSRIAHINISPALSLSLQIPIPTSISILPGPIAPQLPGLWLTTATSLPTDDDINTTSSQLASHFTLLLLSDLSSILSDINATASPLTEPLTHFLRASKPTKSFLQTSQSSDIPLADIQFLASHLIYWRRARAIPPLHQRDTYIVSPNADMRKLTSATSVFAKRFPSFPSLPHFLNMLSFTPRAYATIIPRKDLKEPYLDILAWLLRNGWVTQLRTFAWVRVPAHIKESVAKQPDQDPTQPIPKITNNTNTIDPAKPNPPPSPSPSTSPSSTYHLSLPPPTPSLISNPRHASGLPSRHLSATAAHIRAEQGAEGHDAWLACVRYFNGHYALETIAVMLGWKWKRVMELVVGWEDLGVLVRGRHW